MSYFALFVNQGGQDQDILGVVNANGIVQFTLTNHEKEIAVTLRLSPEEAKRLGEAFLSVAKEADPDYKRVMETINRPQPTDTSHQSFTTSVFGEGE